MENSLLVCWSSFGAHSMCLAHLDCRFFAPWWTILFRLIQAVVRILGLCKLSVLWSWWKIHSTFVEAVFGARSMCLAHLDCRFFTPWWTILFRLIFKRLLEFWLSANCQCFDRDGKFTPRLLLEFLCSLICLAHLDCIYPPTWWTIPSRLIACSCYNFGLVQIFIINGTADCVCGISIWC